jgi:hypothetical protein
MVSRINVVNYGPDSSQQKGRPEGRRSIEMRP